MRPRRHAADGHLRPRLRPVPPRDRPEPLAEENGYLTCTTAAATRSTSRGSTGRGRGPSRSAWRASTSTSRTSTAQGIVEPGGEADRLREEIAERLTGAGRPEERRERRQAGLHRVEVLPGPVQENGPDLIVGYQRGYRVSWETAIGRTTDARLPRQQEGLERRPLRRSVARAGHPVLQPADREREAPADGHRARPCCDVRRGGARLHGRQGADRWRARRGQAGRQARAISCTRGRIDD